MNPLIDLRGKTAVVTGASRGIGAGIAAGLLSAGADLIALQRSPLSNQLLDLAANNQRSARQVPIELSSEVAIAETIAEVTSDTQVDILVNNAGTQIRADSVDFPLADFDTVLNINLRAVFQLCQGFGRQMVERGKGKIINVASLLSYQGGLRVPAYAASKAGVMQLTKALCNEWASKGVNVNAVAPGYFATDMNEALIADPDRNQQITGRIPAGRWGRPADMAGAVVFLASDAADYIHGVTMPVDGGWLAR